MGRIEVTTEYVPQSRFCVQKFGASSQTSHASAIVYLHGAAERGNELSMLTPFGLPAMLAEGRAVTNCTAYGVNDMHIAAHARSEGLVLVTNNMGEFARVPALEAENWVHTAQ